MQTNTAIQAGLGFAVTAAAGVLKVELPLSYSLGSDVADLVNGLTTIG